MALTRWNPGRDLMDLAEDMNRFVRNTFGDATREASFLRGTWNPAVDISEDKDNFFVTIDLPGMNKKDVKVSYEDGVLSISGEKKKESERKEENFHRVERSYGSFERSFRVPMRIVPERIEARFDNGVLTVTLPKAEEVKPKEIEVKIS